MSGLFENIALGKQKRQKQASAKNARKQSAVRKVAGEYRSLFTGVSAREFEQFYGSLAPHIATALTEAGGDLKDITVVKTMLRRHAQETIPTTEPDGNVQPSIAGEGELAEEPIPGEQVTAATQCWQCGGDGRLRCSECGGGDPRCYVCGGDGIVKCPTCNGTGKTAQAVSYPEYHVRQHDDGRFWLDVAYSDNPDIIMTGDESFATQAEAEARQKELTDEFMAEWKIITGQTANNVVELLNVIDNGMHDANSDTSASSYDAALQAITTLKGMGDEDISDACSAAEDVLHWAGDDTADYPRLVDAWDAKKNALIAGKTAQTEQSCPRCGAPVTWLTLYCPTCGVNLYWESLQDERNAQTDDTTNTIPTTEATEGDGQVQPSTGGDKEKTEKPNEGTESADGSDAAETPVEEKKDEAESEEEAVPAEADEAEEPTKAARRRVAWKVGDEYVYQPVGWDAFMPSTPAVGALAPGTRVRVVQPSNAPANGTMDNVYVENIETGEFIGLVHKNSLQKTAQESEITDIDLSQFRTIDGLLEWALDNGGEDAHDNIYEAYAYARDNNPDDYGFSGDLFVSQLEGMGYRVRGMFRGRYGKTAQENPFEKKEEKPAEEPAVAEEIPAEPKPEVEAQYDIGDQIQIADENGDTANPVMVTVVELLQDGIKVRLDEATAFSQPGEYMVTTDQVVQGAEKPMVEEEVSPVEGEEPAKENPFEEKTARNWVYSIPFNSTVEKHHNAYFERGESGTDILVKGMLDDVIPMLRNAVDELRLRGDEEFGEYEVKELELIVDDFEDLQHSVGMFEEVFDSWEQALKEFEWKQDELYNWGDANSVSLMG